MSFHHITDSEIAQDKGCSTTLLTKIRDSLNYLMSNITDSVLALLNGGFENYDASTGIPACWEESKVDATGQVFDDASFGGAAYYKMTQTAVGGYVELLSNFIDVCYLDKLNWRAVARRSTIDLHLVIKIQCFDINQTACAPTAEFTVFDTSTDVLPAATVTSLLGVLGFLAATALPTDCRFVKIYMKLGGGTSSDGVVELDDITVIRSRDLAIVPGTTSRATGAAGDTKSSLWNAVSGTLTIPYSGYYRMYFEWKTTAGYIRFSKNNSVRAYGPRFDLTGDSNFHSAMVVLYFAAGDVVRLYARNDDDTTEIWTQNFAAYGDLMPVIKPNTLY
jgi:hypothetical protein